MVLTVIIENLFDEPPTIKEVAKKMGTSHQNVKQVALKLEKKGLLILMKDLKDARITRLKLSESSYDFWSKLRGESTEFIQALYKDIEEDELKVARRVMIKMQLNINEMDNKSEVFENPQ